MVPLELEAEQKAVIAAVAEWKGKKMGDADGDEIDDEDLYLQPVVAKEEALQEAMEAGKEGRFLARVPIPTQTDIEEALLRRKKQELLALYAIDEDVDKIEKDVKEEDEALAKGGHGPVQKMDVNEESNENTPEQLNNDEGVIPAKENDEVLKPPGEEDEERRTPPITNDSERMEVETEPVKSQ